MTHEQIYELMDGFKAYAEAMGGFRKQLIDEQGFPPDIADAIVLQALRGATGQVQ